MDLVTRGQWGARRPRNVVTGNLTGPSTGHWNGPEIPVMDHSKCASLVRGVQNFHMDSRGWSDIAYNFVVCPHGYTYEGRGLNVVNGANGTNTANRSSHAIMWLAGKGNPFNDAEKLEFRQCVKYVDDHSMAPDSAVGHRDHKSTECPGNERYNWIHQGMPVSGSPSPIPEPIPQPSNGFEELLDMIIGQDQMTGKIYLISGNTKLEFPTGGSDPSSPGKGNVYVDEWIRQVKESYPGAPELRLCALNPDIVSRIPSIHDLIEPDETSMRVTMPDAN